MEIHGCCYFCTCTNRSHGFQLFSSKSSDVTQIVRAKVPTTWMRCMKLDLKVDLKISSTSSLELVTCSVHGFECVQFAQPLKRTF